MRVILEKFAINVKRNFIKILKNKKVARKYKNLQYAKLDTKNFNSFKWGVSYSVFDGIELLEHRIKSIRNSCDYVNVVYSDISWYGHKTDDDILSILQDLKEKKLIDEIIYYKPNLTLSAGENERKNAIWV